jgi:RES domain-containing protein
MIVYRLSKAQYCKDLSGLGAKLYGGRWNMIGTPCVYTSSSRALALLEYSVNVKLEFIPEKLFFTLIEIDDKEIEIIAPADFPKNWTSVPADSITKIFGSEKLNSSPFSILRVPSVVIKNEFNYLLNPLKLNFETTKIIDVEPFQFDFRLKG